MDLYEEAIALECDENNELNDIYYCSSVNTQVIEHDPTIQSKNLTTQYKVINDPDKADRRKRQKAGYSKKHRCSLNQLFEELKGLLPHNQATRRCSRIDLLIHTIEYLKTLQK